ncbi:protein fem-1 homolog B [Frankliniella occidentalis]|uniref:Protein fem-1 homolog B n=1 Tax=Frankliniella occidentalis TaxID=133901 RepID=A0A6J1T1U7_FRAOC|nr:protein fem-1 homolog B [Frankliniella occidentalis]
MPVLSAFLSFGLRKFISEGLESAHQQLIFYLDESRLSKLDPEDDGKIHIMVDAPLEEVCHISDSLRTRVFHAAKDGMAITLYALLADLSSKTADELLAQLVEEEDGQRSTPLIIAARNGHDKVVKLLISRFRINLEQEGVVKFDGYKVEGATALWCASGAGHLKVVKTLVKSGADVDHPTKTNSTPLRAACFDGRLDIVRYLAEHNANVHTANKYNNTCLMVASYRGHGDVVSYLLEKGSDPNVRAQCGATVLHFAAECGQLSIVKELLKYGAQFSLNENGMSPLMVAADRTREDVVDYLILQDFLSYEDKIDALELLGASFANDKDNYSPASAYTHMKRGMELRFKNKSKPILKKLGPPIRAYEYWVEAQNMEEMMARASDVNSIHMESLAIRERILGPNNPEVTHPIIYRGAVFADHAQFDRCIELWMHAVNLRQNTNTSVVKDLLRFAQVFSQMIHVGVDLHYPEVESVMIAGVRELENNKSKIADPGPKDDVETIQEEMETNLVTMLYLLCISNKLLTSFDSNHEYYQSLNRITFQANRVNARTRLGETLLHLCVNADTPLDDFHINDVCKFPCAVTAKLLIQTGADVNAMDKNRNTPLHVIVSFQRPLREFMTIHTIIMDLTSAGAHQDICNIKGETPYDATTGVAELILRTQAKLSLKCLAAKVVKAHNIPYIGQVPITLESFIELHGPGSNEEAQDSQNIFCLLPEFQPNYNLVRLHEASTFFLNYG